MLLPATGTALVAASLAGIVFQPGVSVARVVAASSDNGTARIAADEPLPLPVTQSLDDTTPRIPAASVGVVSPTPSAIAGLSAVPGIPAVALAAYRDAALRASHTVPGCRLRWEVLAGIGYIESGHARGHGPADSRWDGVARPAILGPVLDGHGVAAIPDTDGGVLDGDRRWDRAVGPMQFIPSTWRRFAVDADGRDRPDPENINDASAAAADYLCAVGVDTSEAPGLVTAVFAYNHSYDYVRAVLETAAAYGDTTPAVTTALATLPAPASTPTPSPTPTPTPTRRTAPVSPTPSPTRERPTSPSASPTPTPTAAESGSPTPTAS